MFNTGARVQEALDVRRRDVRLDSPPQIRLTGKGNKVRLCPIWPVTVKLLRAFIDELPAAELQRDGADPAADAVRKAERASAGIANIRALLGD